MKRMKAKATLLGPNEIMLLQHIQNNLCTYLLLKEIAADHGKLQLLQDKKGWLI